MLFRTGQPEKTVTSIEMEECTVNSAYIKNIHYNPYEKDKHLILLNIYHKDSQMHKYTLLTLDNEFSVLGKSEHGYCQDSVFIGRFKVAKLKQSDTSSLQVYDYEK